MLALAMLLWTALAAAGPTEEYLRWASRVTVVEHPEPDYHFRADIHAALAPLVAERPGVVQPFVAGHTVEGRPVWAFRVRDPARPAHHKMLVFGGIHALEWLGVESAFRFLLDAIAHPPPGVEVVVIPILNVDRRLQVEADLLRGDRIYRRSNVNGVDLNRDFAVNRESDAVWKHLIPARYSTSPGPLSQPESQLIDRLADAERFDSAVSMHCFGGYIYYPWSGLFERPPDREEFVRIGREMQRAQSGWSYRVQQLSHWGFFFRALGSEIDHLYGKYDTKAFLIEMSRSGIHPLKPETWKDPFYSYNPQDPEHHAHMGFQALRALAWYHSR